MKTIFGTFAVLLLLSACSGGGGGGSSTSPGSGAGSSTPGAGGSIANLASATNGWGNCHIQTAPISDSTVMKVTGSTVELLSKVYYASGSNPCVSGDEFLETKVIYTITTSGTNSTITSATNANLKLVSIQRRLLTSGTANDLNTGVNCGKTDWVANQWADISGTSCGRPLGSTVYTIFKINSNQLTFGQTSGADDGTTEDKRHSYLDSSAIYTKM